MNKKMDGSGKILYGLFVEHIKDCIVIFDFSAGEAFEQLFRNRRETLRDCIKCVGMQNGDFIIYVREPYTTSQVLPIVEDLLSEVLIWW